MTITPTPEINYLVLVVGGIALFHYGVEAEAPGAMDVAVTAIGVALFAIGTLRALMGAFNV